MRKRQSRVVLSGTAALLVLVWIGHGCTLAEVCGNDAGPCRDSEFHLALLSRLSKPTSAQTTTTGGGPCNPCNIFVTSANQRPGVDFVSPATADARCMADSFYPGSGTYKALLVSSGTRLACTSNNCVTSGAAENLDWVLHAGTTYRRLSDASVIMTTNSAGIFVFGSLSSPFGTGVPGWWTGMNATTWRLASACTGNNWSTTAGNANFGDPNLTTSGSLSNGTDPCTTLGSKLLCVQQ